MYHGQLVKFKQDFQNFKKGDEVMVDYCDYYGFVYSSEGAFPAACVEVLNPYKYVPGQKVKFNMDFAQFKTGDIAEIKSVGNDLLNIGGTPVKPFRVTPTFVKGQKVILNQDYDNLRAGKIFKVRYTSQINVGRELVTCTPNLICYSYRLNPHKSTRGPQKRFYWLKGSVAGCTDNLHSYEVFKDSGYKRIAREDYRYHSGQFTEMNHPSNIVDEALGRSYGH